MRAALTLIPTKRLIPYVNGPSVHPQVLDVHTVSYTHVLGDSTLV